MKSVTRTTQVNGKQVSTPTDNSYRCMKARCLRTTHPYYYMYGGAGVKICDRWLNGEGGLTGFECFVADVGERPSKYHTLDRKDGKLGYTKDNCEWRTKKQQQNNLKSNRIIVLDGVNYTLSEAVDKYKMRANYFAIVKRMGRGMDFLAAVAKPFPERKKRAA